MNLDRASLLIHVDGRDAIGDVQRALEAESLTLALTSALPPMTVARWLAEGAPGARARFVDPVDQLVAGFRARFHDGRTVTLEPAPRRSVGPDLFALIFGLRERYATILSAELRALVQGASYAAPRFDHVDPPLSPEEERVLARLFQGER